MSSLGNGSELENCAKLGNESRFLLYQFEFKINGN